MHQDQAITRTARFALFALLYLEEAGLAPERFTAARMAAWRGMMPHSRELDLFELAVRDGVRTNPHLFAAFADTAARNELRALDQRLWQEELQRLRTLNLAHMPIRKLYLEGAETLEIELPTIQEAMLEGRPLDRSSLVAEMPDGCGYPALLVCQMYDVLDAAHNLRIFTASVTAEMLASWAVVLLTRQLTLPPDRIIHVTATDHALLVGQAFETAMIYRPVTWLDELRESISARESITL